MFKKLLNRDIDERLQSRLDMISGLFEQPEGLLSGDQADPQEQLAAAGFDAEAHADPDAMLSSGAGTLTLTEPRMTFDNGEHEVQPALLRRSDEITKADGGGGLLSRLRGKRASTGGAPERPLRAIPPAPDFDDSDEPLTLTVRHKRLAPPDSARTGDTQPEEQVVPITPALPSMSDRPDEPGSDDDAGTAGPRQSEPALVLRLTPTAMAPSTLALAEDTADAPAPGADAADDAPPAGELVPGDEIAARLDASAGLTVLDLGAHEATDAPEPESPETGSVEPAEADEVPADLELVEVASGDAPAPEAAVIEDDTSEPVEATSDGTFSGEPAGHETASGETAGDEAVPTPLRGSESRSRGILPIDGLDSYIGEPFKPGVGFTPVVAIISGEDRFVLRTARLALEDDEEFGRRLSVAWFHSSPQALPLPDDADGSVGAKRAARTLGFVVNALRDEQFAGDIVAYGGYDPASAEARMANRVLDLVFAAADDLVGHGLEEDVSSNGQLPSPGKLMQAAFVEWSGGPRKSEDHSQAFARLTAAREPGRLSVAPPAGRENGPGSAGGSRIGFAS